MEQHEIDGLTILERAAMPTPKFFRYLKVIGLTLAAVSGSLLAAPVALLAAPVALLAAPVALPAIITTIAGYVAVAGTVVTAISQVTVES